MPQILPFRGVRYNQSKIADLDNVVTPPYDVISPADRERFYARHPQNVIRLILPQEGRERDKYSEASACLRAWLDDDILVQDTVPSMYVCEQEYELKDEVKRRIGLTCLVRLEDYDRRTILPHERVLARPREDRLNLIRATEANFDSVFGLHAGSGVQQLLSDTAVGPPAVEAADSAGVKSRVWPISDTQILTRLSAGLENVSILIADGHHRYEAALAYRDEMRARTRVPNSDAPYEYLMMTLVSLEDEGLTVLPTHRMVRNLRKFELSDFTSRLSEYFEASPTSAEALMASVESAEPDAPTFGLYAGGGQASMLRLKSSVDTGKIPVAGSDALKRLDVTVLHSLILDSMLGIDTRTPEGQAMVSYTRDDAEALTLVDSGEYRMAFLMNPMRVEEARTVASAGDVMPQKSTFFYPKLLTGLVIRVI